MDYGYYIYGVIVIAMITYSVTRSSFDKRMKTLEL